MTDPKIVYVVVASGGSYDSSWTTNVFASLDKGKVEAKVIELEVSDEKDKKTAKELNELRAFINQDLDELQLEPTLDRPVWKSGLSKTEITQAMQNERLKVELKNKKINERNHKKWLDREKIIVDRQRKFLTEIGYSSDHPFFTGVFNTEDVTYSIDEVVLI